MRKMGHNGLELESVSSCKTNRLRNSPKCSAVISGAIDDKKPPQDPDLALIIERWEHLPEPVKTGIMAMVKSVKGEGE